MTDPAMETEASTSNGKNKNLLRELEKTKIFFRFLFDA